MAKVQIKPGDFITLKKYLNGDIKFWHKQMHLPHGVLSRKPEPPSRSKKYYVPKAPIDPVRRSQIARQNKQKSPWNRSNALLQAFRTTCERLPVIDATREVNSRLHLKGRIAILPFKKTPSRKESFAKCETPTLFKNKPPATHQKSIR